MAHPLGHFKTITKHRHKVIRNCFKAGLFWQGLRHDLSKYSPTEFIPGAKFYLGTRSPNEKEREVRIMRKEKLSVILQPGFIIKEEISIIMNIGQI